jgi:amino acid adenylation domain-containing protein
MMTVANGTKATLAEGVLALFDTQVAQRPSAVAVSQDSHQLTYEELASRVARVARSLQARGVRAGDVVGLMIPRSLDAVVGILGVLRAGAAYLPTDPATPQSRVDHMVGECGVRLMIVQAEDASAQHAGSGYDTVLMADLASGTEAPAGAFEEPAPDAIAYVIYTSGSTGTPKGVQVSHRALLHYVSWASRYYVADQPVDMPLFSSFAFDLTVTSIYVPLITGGTVFVYADPGGSRDLSIHRVMTDNRVRMIKLTPSHLALVASMDLSDSKIEKMILGGEDLKSSLALKVHHALGGEIEIYNEYGPTEATVGCMIYRFDPSVDSSGSVPIGRAIEGAEILVLDADGKPVSESETGEIFIGGAGLAEGYVNRPDATRERFLAHPSGVGRVYRTGDLARYRDDGELDFLGRADRQVKVGGVRIELGEVESVIEDLAGVSAAVALVRDPSESTKEVVHCVRCALPSNYPGVTYDDNGLCGVCQEYDRYRDRAQAYFGTRDELREILMQAKATGEGDYDCMMLFSGGKDSSYVLYQLLEMDLKVLAYTLDNGYISEDAKKNIRRIVGTLGVDHVFGTTEAMNDIFRDSLRQFSNVCNGCFKTIYTLSMQLAAEHGIKYIVTGLTRGQLFETRLDFLFRNQVFDLEEIEKDIQKARSVYHARRDVVSEKLLRGTNTSSQQFGEIRFVDYFRYSDVDRTEMMSYLESRKDWVRPADTGRSTNCLINDVGIFIHNKERGYHNYALPYCWDVRLGLLDRAEALEELSVEVNMSNVNEILGQVAYDSSHQSERHEPRLAAYYASQTVDPETMRRHAAGRLPASMMPADFVQLDELPLTLNGKVDLERLPEPNLTPKAAYVTSKNQLERRIAEIWERLLDARGFGVSDSFFDLGGTSMLAVLLHTQLEDLADVEIPLEEMGERWTITDQAAVLRAHGYEGTD